MKNAKSHQFSLQALSCMRLNKYLFATDTLFYAGNDGTARSCVRSRQFQRLAKEASALEETVSAYNSYKDAMTAILDTQQLLKESTDDPEMAEMAEEELAELQSKVEV
ncbi:MAG: PCRF domain-containing protein [Akkermansiaceae bacterium]|nr:PCRF domain-containing protein [Akkermansiaceae bacterium]